MNIGEQRRTIQVEPVDVPVPEALPIDEPAEVPLSDPTPDPAREPIPSVPGSVER